MCRIYLQKSRLSKRNRKANAAIVNCIGFQANCKQESANRKFTHFWDHSSIANPQIRFFINPKIANKHIFTKYCTSLSPNSHESHIFSYVQI